MNPVERFGSFDLPESQLDRFMMSVSLGYPDREHEREILDRDIEHVHAEELEPVTDVQSIMAARKAVTEVKVESSVTEYLLDLVKATREHPEIRLGLSSRAGLHLKRASQAHALMEGRDYVIPQDLRTLFVPVGLHRILLSSSSEGGGSREAKANLLGKILRSVAAPI
jgi:MoxR-like ATPase